MRLESKNIVVTGASSGMGHSIVETFVKEGANVVAVARRKERLEELAETLKDAAGKIAIYPGDVSKLEINEGMIDFCVREFGSLDVLVNNAGIMDYMAPLEDATDEKYRQVFEVNVYGPMASMRKALQIFKEQGKGGNIINVASMGAFRAIAGPIYCASKAALVSLSKNTAFMHIDDKIRCNVIAPGGIATEIASSMGMPNMNGYAQVGKLLAYAPAIGTCEDIANAALFLASDESCYITGDVLFLDGGWNAG